MNLSELLQQATRPLGLINKSKATSGSATTVVDTTLAGKWKNNQWKDGWMYVSKTTDGLAPQGEFNRISLYDNSTSTFTVDTAFTAVVGAGDTYIYIDDTYPGLMLIDFANDGLRSLDMLDLTDIATITIADDKLEYAGAVAWKRAKPWKIERATSADTNAYGWVEITDWNYDSSAAGSAPLILFKQQYTSGYPTIKVHYKDLHPEVTLYSDKIREEVHPDLAVSAMAVKALEWYVTSNSGQDDFSNQRLADARNELDRMRVLHPVTKAQRTYSTKTIEIRI